MRASAYIAIGLIAAGAVQLYHHGDFWHCGGLIGAVLLVLLFD